MFFTRCNQQGPCEYPQCSNEGPYLRIAKLWLSDHTLTLIGMTDERAKR